MQNCELLKWNGAHLAWVCRSALLVGGLTCCWTGSGRRSRVLRRQVTCHTKRSKYSALSITAVTNAATKASGCWRGPGSGMMDLGWGRGDGFRHICWSVLRLRKPCMRKSSPSHRLWVERHSAKKRLQWCALPILPCQTAPFCSLCPPSCPCHSL